MTTSAFLKMLSMKPVADWTVDDRERFVTIMDRWETRHTLYTWVEFLWNRRRVRRISEKLVQCTLEKREV